MKAITLSIFYLLSFSLNASKIDSLIFINIDEVLSDLKKNDTLSKYYEYETYDSITDLDKTTISKLLNIHLFFDDETLKRKLIGQRKYPRKHIQIFKTKIISLKEFLLNRELLNSVLERSDFEIDSKVYIKGNKMALISVFGGNGDNSWAFSFKFIKKKSKLKFYIISGFTT